MKKDELSFLEEIVRYYEKRNALDTIQKVIVNGEEFVKYDGEKEGRWYFWSQEFLKEKDDLR